MSKKYNRDSSSNISDDSPSNSDDPGNSDIGALETMVLKLWKTRLMFTVTSARKSLYHVRNDDTDLC